jgi:hypothetical protein
MGRFSRKFGGEEVDATEYDFEIEEVEGPETGGDLSKTS